MMEVDKIREKISSENVAILKQSLGFVIERVSNEKARGLRAETRAVANLAFAGVLLSIVIVRLPTILQDYTFTNWALIFTLYLATIVFLLKSAVFALKSLGVLKRNEVTPELVFFIQQRSEIDALREEITYRIWEYYQLLSVSNERLRCVNRTQRNTLAAMATFSVLGIISFPFEVINLSVTKHFNPDLVDTFTKSMNIIVIAIILVSIFLLDFVAEKLGGFWRRVKAGGY
jgi:hypothetical protein